jgi:hypothetical protein
MFLGSTSLLCFHGRRGGPYDMNTRRGQRRSAFGSAFGHLKTEGLDLHAQRQASGDVGPREGKTREGIRGVQLQMAENCSVER